MGQYDRAIEHFTRCLAHNPKFYAALVYLTAIYTELGRTDEAKATGAKVLEPLPEFSIKKFEAVWPVADPTVMNQLTAGLRLAGAPE